MERIKNENLYGWVFAHNPYTKEWMTVKREDYGLMFSDIHSDKVLRSSQLDTLVQIINKTNGDINKLTGLIYEH